MKFCCIWICVAACFGLWVQGGRAQGQPSNSKHPVTVADSIRMTRLADPNYLAGARAKPQVAHFSPDGKRFVVILRKGNLGNNTNEYSLLLFHTANAFNTRSPEVLLTLASSSNRPAIQHVTWLGDNDTVVFLGERPGGNQQFYRLNCRTKKLKMLTDHPTNVITFSMAREGESFAFVAEKPRRPVQTEKARREGIRVTTQLVTDMISGKDRESIEDNEVFVKHSDSRRPKRLELQTHLVPYAPVSLSPDGRYLVTLTRPRHVPDSWKEYKDDRLQKILSYGLRQYTLVDTRNGENKPLIDAPLGSLGTEAAWSPDSRSLVVTGVYLPLEGTDGNESEARRASTFVAEVRMPGREIIKLPDGDVRLIKWDAKTGKLLFQSGRMNALLGKGVPKVAYSRQDGTWKETEVSFEAQDPIEVSLDEDLNTPPRVFVQDPKSEKRSLLLDLNPQFSSLSLARAEHIRWKATDGHEVDGGLYLPPDYVPGKKYPLILQTHGFNPDRFWMDGPWTTAFAAQAFASKGFVVLQVPDWPDLNLYPKIIATPAEGPYQMSSYEGAIDYLDDRGLIDRDRVGIIGFSRTSFYVKFALVHSKYKFAAASVADGFDVGYFQQVAFSNAALGLSSEAERMIGALPFGQGLSSWLKLSPGFNLDKIRTPLRIEALGSGSLLGEWEWFAGLSRLWKAVDLIYQPEADHIIEKPWERLVSQQGNVDWFSFWLKGEEDPAPAKTEQYAYWHKLRNERSQDPRPQN
jgi:dipeptidyl aminopeptidase/acylaminoacyl peptidase